MKKLISLLLIFATISMIFAGCSDEDKETAKKDPLIGTWYFEEDDFTFVFEEGGKGRVSEGDDSGSMTWSVDGDVLTVVIEESETEEFKYKVNGNKLTLIEGSEEAIFVRK